MKIRIVIPTLNNMFLTVGALLSLRAELGENLDVVIVDNGSDAETLANLRADIDQPGSGVRFITNEIPRAYARSVNMGANLEGLFDAVLVANNDVIFAPGSIAAMVAGLSHRLARIYAPELEAQRKADAKEAWDIAAEQNVENVPVKISPAIGRYFR